MVLEETAIAHLPLKLNQDQFLDQTITPIHNHSSFSLIMLRKSSANNQEYNRCFMEID